MGFMFQETLLLPLSVSLPLKSQSRRVVGPHMDTYILKILRSTSLDISPNDRYEIICGHIHQYSYKSLNCCEVQVVLPEGSRDISVSAPFPVKQWQEVLLSKLSPFVPSLFCSFPMFLIAMVLSFWILK